MTRRLHALRVGNFKAFADTQRIPIKPITLIFGPNSAGKSSFIHSLALAHEAQFGREKRSLARLDVHHTDVGGNSIDLGGFRQYVHRGQLNKRVEWGAGLKVSALDPVKDKRLTELLAPVSSVELNISLGIQLDDQARPKPGKDPHVESVEIIADGTELIRMSLRLAASGAGAQASHLRLDRIDSKHPVFLNVLRAIVESHSTTSEMRPDDFEGANEALNLLIPELVVRVEQFFPSSVEIPKRDGDDISPVSTLFAISKGNRKEDIAKTIRLVFPRRLNELIKGIAEALAEELKQLQYLGPLRSLPDRHLAFSEREDANWYAGGGYAWEVLRRDDVIREAVNVWLGSKGLKTPYKLVVQSLVAVDQLKDPLADGLFEITLDDNAMFLGSLDSTGGQTFVTEHHPPRDDARPFFKDTNESAETLVKAVDSSDIDRVHVLKMVDLRTNTQVTHRDVGIGISQVLPVLVMAYGSQEKLLAIEQPEIHLHPGLQAELADVFIESALGPRQNTFILETHSEHLILRLMRRMRETYQGKETGLPPVTPADVSVLYCEPHGSRSIVREMPLNELGELVKSWPGGFFEEGLREQFGDA